MTELAQLSRNICDWLKSLQVPNCPGAFKLAREGDLLAPSEKQGLGFSSLALKIAYTINAHREFSPVEMERWVDYINAFQVKQGPMKSYYEDIGLLHQVDGLRFKRWILKGPFKGIKNLDVRRAETRQALGALLCVDRHSPLPTDFLPKNSPEVVRYFHDLGWKNPWHAGSQMGHLLFFLKYNREHFGRDDQGHAQVVWKELAKLQDQETGAWFIGAPKKHVIINGAMKVLIAYDHYKKEIERPKELIDLCLGHDTRSDGCHLLDQIYVLHACLKQTPYRKSEIEQFASDLKSRLRAHQKSDGAFSFFPEKSQVNYYGSKVTRGLSESDLHGTHLFTWTLVLIEDILNNFKANEWNHPVT